MNVQVQKRKKRISNVTEIGEKHAMIWGMFMTVTMESTVSMGKNYQNNCHSIMNTTDLTLNQMFDISTKLVSEQDEISGLETIAWEGHSSRYLSLIDDERIIGLQRTKVYVFSESVLCLGKIFESPESNDAWEQRLGWINLLQITDTLTESKVNQWNSSGIFFPAFNTLQLSDEVKKFNVQIGRNTRTFHKKNSIYVDVQRHFLKNKRQ